MSGLEFKISDYDKLVVLYRVLQSFKFSEAIPVDPVLVASPLIGEIARDLVNVLSSIEHDQGYKRSPQNWEIKLEENSKKWDIAIRNAILVHEKSWRGLSDQEKENIAQTFLSPFDISEESIRPFIQAIDKAIKAP